MLHNVNRHCETWGSVTIFFFFAQVDSRGKTKPIHYDKVINSGSTRFVISKRMRKNAHCWLIASGITRTQMFSKKYSLFAEHLIKAGQGLRKILLYYKTQYKRRKKSFSPWCHYSTLRWEAFAEVINSADMLRKFTPLRLNAGCADRLIEKRRKKNSHLGFNL